MEALRYIRDRLDNHLPITYPTRNAGPMARVIAHEGRTPLPSDPFSRTYHPSDPILDELFPLFKVERYALAAVMTDKIVDRALENRTKYPPLGFIPRYEVAPEESAQGLQRPWGVGMLDALTQAYVDVRTELDTMSDKDKNSTSPTLSFYRRFKQLEEFGLRHYYFNFGSQTVANGITTAVSIMVDTLDSIPHLYAGIRGGKQISEDELTQIGRNTYPFIAELARLHFHSFMSVFEKGSFRERIELVETSRGLSVDLNRKGKSLLHRRPKEYSKRRYRSDRVTLGCPSTVSTNGAPPIKKLWDWQVEVASQTLKTL